MRIVIPVRVKIQKIRPKDFLSPAASARARPDFCLRGHDGASRATGLKV